MGLDTSHDCWHGPYSSFHYWRNQLAIAAELPPLELMEGFYRGEDQIPWVLIKNSGALEQAFESVKRSILDSLPIKWECLKPDPLHILLQHSDCEDDIKNADCKPIAESLKNSWIKCRMKILSTV